MALVITNNGLDKAVQADFMGVNFKITHVALGASGYTPDKTMTSLQNELVRVPISGGKMIDINHLHFTALFDGEAEIIAREIGFYLEDGTLFAIDSDPNNVLVYKSSTTGSRALEGFDLILDSIPIDSILVDTSGDLVINYDKEFGALQFTPYDPTRTYKTGEVCTIEINGEVIAMQMYAGPNLTCIGKNPADETNRQNGWIDEASPFWWVPHKAARPGTTLWPWMSMTIPEGTLNVLGNSVPVVVFWRLAIVLPEFVNAETGMIDFPETGGEFFRVLDQGRGVDSGRLIKTAQLSELGNHQHKTYGLVHQGFKSGVGTIGGTFPDGSDYAGAYYGSFPSGPYRFDTNPYTNKVGGSETRSRNLAFPILVEV